MTGPNGEKFILSLRESGGAPGDLGTLSPLMLRTIATVRLALVRLPLRRDAKT